MIRGILGAVVGAAAWVAVVFAVSFGIRMLAPDLGAALNAHATVAALVERLAISFVASLAGGLVAALVSGEGWRAALGAGVILLIVFVPYHTTIWTQFPIWYHLTFFASLPLLSLLGGRIVRR
jgi:hypothetical protein